MTASRSDNVHPAYVEVVKQLSPRDAASLSQLDPEGENLVLAEFGEYMDSNRAARMASFSFIDDLPPELIWHVLSSLERAGVLAPTQRSFYKGSLVNGSACIYGFEEPSTWRRPLDWSDRLERLVEAEWRAEATDYREFGGDVQLVTFTAFGQGFYDAAIRSK